MSKTRIAIINTDKCKPKKCAGECKRICPVVRMGNTDCVVIDLKTNATISEDLCIGCGMCSNKCPFNAIKIINLPNNLTPVLFKYGPNSFQLHRLPNPRLGKVVGMIGVNGIGKSTILKILAGKLTPNWGDFSSTLTPAEIITMFRGSELQAYFTHLLEDTIKITIKPQMIEYLATIPKHKNTLVKTIFPDILTRQRYNLDHLSDRPLHVLSGGELQRLSIAKVCETKTDIYAFDEPTNYLDVKERIAMGEHIRNIALDSNKYVLVIDHDVAILDFVSDYVHCLYGKQTAYGVVSLPATTREGINNYIKGFLPSENMRIRDHDIKFIRTADEDENEYKYTTTNKYDYRYENLHIQQGSFYLDVEPGGWNRGDIVLLIGRNGTGKTTFIRAIAGLNPDVKEIPVLNISYKPQKIKPKFKGTVTQLLRTKIGWEKMTNSIFRSDVIIPLEIDDIKDNLVQNLSGGELQRLAITIALGKPADVYLLDEPSSMLDVEMRLSVASSIRRYIKHISKTAIIVEHDILMALYLADRMIIYSGQPGINCTAHTPTDKETGMNNFLRSLDVTIRQDPETMRPRINKPGSAIDTQQKQENLYYKTTKSRRVDPADPEGPIEEKEN